MANKWNFPTTQYHYIVGIVIEANQATVVCKYNIVVKMEKQNSITSL